MLLMLFLMATTWLELHSGLAEGVRDDTAKHVSSIVNGLAVNELG